MALSDEARRSGQRSAENPRFFIFLGGLEVDGSASAGRGNRLLTRAAPILARAYPATFDTSLMMRAGRALAENGWRDRYRITLPSMSSN